MLGATPAPFAGGAPWSDAQIASLDARLDRALRAPALRGAQVGFLAVDARRGTEVYARDADGAFAPASSFKLLVGSAALRYLGASFTFVTTVSADTVIGGATLPGNLYLRGGGDAHLSTDDLRSAAAALFRAGLRRVDGALITDASHDDAQRYAPGWSWDDLPYGYAAAVSALELEGGTVHVYVTPGAAAGAPPQLRIQPQSDAFVIENRATTAAAGSDDTTDVARPWDSPLTIRVVGSYPAGAPESDDLAPSVPDPERYAGDVFLRALRDAGIVVAGGVRSGVTPVRRSTLWQHDSVALPQLLSEFWLPSDNLMGELFLKELGASQAGEPGTYAKGIVLEQEYLRSLGIDPATVAIADGSGLSVYDRVTPRDLVTVLRSDWNGSARGSVLAALPEAGVRGTLKRDFAGSALAGRLYAKTGSMRHTRALCGYIDATAHGPVAFSLLVNGWLGDDEPGGAAALAAAEADLLSAFLSNETP
ncbi:MAG TPA: D-alanyl-D-alanine carboxypeptidase/D-alanyl-D-alanine-endopeptidase [Candidatus Cybelea sp.]|jgi:D-alanyl-D-alanine carboxypeptidase/D-alanyl-D-alanine-endopeptidase (penicillin-binding protein 4)|nr:D-alanyl-D-alanine carboxypeptidase/D-alanyl-D-alanine-endopeptidase [Candidatus Cybelea sp.]